jgi:hypothetical protein
MAKYDVPAKAEDRMKDLNEHILLYQTEYKEFKEKSKKACGCRSKKALTVVKKLITAVRRDIQEEVDNTKKEKAAEVAAPAAPAKEEVKA